MLGKNFPISEYYRENILDARTISRGGRWWTAALLIQDPGTDRPIVALYRWQMTKSGWKTRKRFSFRSRKDIEATFAVVSYFGKKLTESNNEEQGDDPDLFNDASEFGEEPADGIKREPTDDAD